MPDEKIDQRRPAHAESELKKMQQRLIDDTVDDSFPASDPPAWTTGGAKSVAATTDSDRTPDDINDTGIGLSDFQDAASRISKMAEQAYEAGLRYARVAQERYPEAGRYVQQGRRAVSQPVENYPLAALVLAGAVGFGLAWFVYGRDHSRDRGI